MRKFILSMLAVAAASALAATLAASTRAAPARSHAVTTVTLGAWSSSPEETALLTNVISAFEAAHPTINVNLELSDNYKQTMEGRFAAGNPPDVFYVDSSYAPDWIADGFLLPLQGFAQKSGFDTSHFLPLLRRAFEGPGSQPYGFPKDWSPLAMFTNNSLLAQAGVTAPTTWAQLRSAAEAIKSTTGVTPICVSADWARLLAFVEENGGSWLDASGTASAINSPAAQEAVEFYLGLVTDGLASEPSTLGSSWCGQAFADGKVAIAFEGNWLVPVLDAAAPPVDYSIHPMLSNVQRGNLAFTVAYSIAAASQHKQAAWELLSYLTGREGMQLWANGGLALPARDDVTPAPGRQVFLDEAPISTIWQFGLGFSDVLTFANAQLADVFVGNQTIDAMLTAIEAAENAALAHG
jgi:multiple sugar transport system substrate-binding protein